MNEQERFDKLIRKYPHPHVGFYDRPLGTRRQFFRLLGTGLTGHFLSGSLIPTPAMAQGPVATQGTAKQVIFVFLKGAASQPDTFDFKMTPDTPSDFAPETINGIQFPVGLLPNLAQCLDKMAIIRSGFAWALAHGLAQTWLQIGRNPVSATGGVAPHVGSVVGLEKDPERRPDQILPTFIALNAANAPGAGYFPVSFGPFKTQPSAGGLTSTQHADGQARFEKRWGMLQLIDADLRGPDSPLGAPAAGMTSFYDSARNLMFNPVVDDAFTFTTEESLRYGDSAFGDACVIAKKIVAADQGTRFIQIDLDGWDHHTGIYDRNEVNGRETGQNIYAQSAQLDPALAALLGDLEADGLLDETLVVISSEFGRTIGPITNDRNGRDHYSQMFYLFAGGGVTGGKVIGETSADGAFTIDPGWSRFRDVRPEDIEATIYSALGIDWTTVRDDDPLGRGFEYVPGSAEDLYGPVDELWTA